jgi:hypothetical protein
MTEKTEFNKKPHLFQKGVSGNPAGRPKGSRSKVALIAEDLLAGELDAVLAAMLERAKSGDVAAGRLVLERVLPAAGTYVELDLPDIHTGQDAAAARIAVMRAVANGEITADGAAKMMTLIKDSLAIQETAEWAEDLAELVKAHREKERPGKW